MKDFSTESYMPDAPGIMWAAPYCLHDSSSGAAVQMRLIYEQLVKRGLRCHVVSALTFDAPNGKATFPNLDEQLKQSEAQWFNVQDKGVSYQYYRTKSIVVGEMTRDEEIAFYQGFVAALERFKPDMLLIYGGCILEIGIIAECHRRGIAICMHIPNGNYANFHFPNVDLLFTDCERSARIYHANSKVNIMPVGTFIDPQKVVCADRLTQAMPAPETEEIPKKTRGRKKKMVSAEEKAPFITLINPCPAKGISIGLRLALMAQEKHPHWKFLMVESRGTWAQAMHLFQQDPSHFPNVSVAQHTTDIRLVYEQTKLLLVPSLWYEGFGRVAAEATMNGIPVLASNSGGLPNAVNGGGICLDAPEKCRENFNYMPTEEEILPWLEALEEMLSEEKYPEWVKKSRKASIAHDLEKNTDRLLYYLTPLLNRRASFHPQYYIR